MSAIQMNSDAFRSALAQEGKYVLVDFWAPWCTYCRRIGPAYEKIAQEYGDKMIVGKVNIDDEPELASQEQIEVIPTLVLYRGGRSVSATVAPGSAGELRRFLDEALAR